MDNNVTDTEMAALTATTAMATVTIEPAKRSRMITCLCHAVLLPRRIPPKANPPLVRLSQVYRGSVCGEKMVLRSVSAYSIATTLQAPREPGLGRTAVIVLSLQSSVRIRIFLRRFDMRPLVLPLRRSDPRDLLVQVEDLAAHIGDTRPRLRGYENSGAGRRT